MRTGHEPARGFVSSFYFGRRRTDIRWMSCAPSRALLIYKRYPKRIPFVYKRVLPDSNGSYLRSTSVGANGSPLDFQHPVSRNEGLRRTRRFEVSALLRSVRGRIVIFYSFIRDEGVAGAVFLRNKSTYWPLAWLVLNSETHV